MGFAQWVESGMKYGIETLCIGSLDEHKVWDFIRDK